ncbi:MAG: hypothetical protein Q7T89_19845, partial [Anaerolineales bacterium]|nr:hypothetical protein [Anaerolineales bacterium]
VVCNKPPVKLSLDTLKHPDTPWHCPPGQVCAARHIVPTLAPYASAVCSFGNAVRFCEKQARFVETFGTVYETPRFIEMIQIFHEIKETVTLKVAVSSSLSLQLAILHTMRL